MSAVAKNYQLGRQRRRAGGGGEEGEGEGEGGERDL
jgi:hypothetical protein